MAKNKRRDFSEEKRATIIKEEQTEYDEGFWGLVSDALETLEASLVGVLIGVSPLYSMIKPIVKKYSSELKQKSDSICTDINTIFKRAHQEDTKYAHRGCILNGCGTSLIKKLELLTQLAQPNGGFSPLLNGKRISDYPELLEESVVISKIDTITDEDLIRFSEDLTKEDWRRLLVNTTDALGDFGLLTAIMISLFNHEDIILSEVLKSGGGLVALKRHVYQNIVDGKDGYISLSELSKQAGVEEDVIKYYMEKGSLVNYKKPLQPGTISKVGEGQYQLYELSQMQAKIDIALDKEVDRVLNSEEALTELCIQLGTSKEVVEAALNNELSGYSIDCYEKAVSKAVEAIADREEIELSPKKYKELIGILGDAEKLATADGTGKEMKEAMEKYMKNDIFSEKEAKEFLKKYCKIEKPSSDLIDAMQVFQQATDQIKDINDFVKKAQKGVDAVSYWLADYDKELQILETVENAGVGDPNYKKAVENLRVYYSDKYSTTINGALEELVKAGVGEVKGTVPLLGITETAIEFTGKVTGTSGTYDAASDIVTLTSVCSNTTSAYDNALDAIAAGDHSPEALNQVRASFTIMKQTMTQYYEAQIEYYDGNLFTAENTSQKLYLNYQLDQIKNAELGDKIEILSYDDYIKNYKAS